MQIGNNVYIDIRVKGSDKRNIIKADNMKRLELVETAGASLPYFYASFFTFDRELADLFMQNNLVEVLIGETEENADTFTIQYFPPEKPKNNDPSGNSWTVEISGFLGNMSYMMDRDKTKAYPGHSLMAVKRAIKGYKGLNSTIDTDIEKTNENQVIWRQTAEPTSNFIVKTLLHMDIRPSFPLFTFDKYGTFHVRDYDKVKNAEPAWKFQPTSPAAGNEIQYINNFNVDSFQSMYNLYSGYNKVTEIYNSATGLSQYVVNDNTPVLASTEEAEKLPSGNRLSLNRINSSNVHKTYTQAFAFNTNKLMSLSSMLGVIKLIGYYPKLKPTDLVYVKTGKTGGSDATLEGYYLIDSIVLAPTFGHGNSHFTTYVYVTRDNKNNVENFIVGKPKKKFNLTKKFVEGLVNAVSRTRTALATCSQIMDGTFLSAVRSFTTSTKNNLLKMFSVSGTMLDFTDYARFLQSSLCAGNSIMNALISMLFPDFIAKTLRDYLIDNPSARVLVDKYVDEYVPTEIQGIISDLIDALWGVQDSLNSIARENGITAREVLDMDTNVDNSTFNAEENRVDSIITSFENNTTGLDIPFPIIELTESQKLLPEDELTNLVADETVKNLEELGYLEGVDVEEFKEILKGETPIDFAIISQINENAGDKFNYRFWGTYGPSNEALYAWAYEDKLVFTKKDVVNEYTRLYNVDYTPYMGKEFQVIEEDRTYKLVYITEGEEKEVERDTEHDINSNALAQLTDYYISKGYKDRYRTIPCTKLVSALNNSRLYFACPSTEENIKFYINSKRVELKSFPINLGYTDIYGNPIMYNVYYTTTGYNSNSTLLEIRQG